MDWIGSHFPKHACLCRVFFSVICLCLALFSAMLLARDSASVTGHGRVGAPVASFVRGGGMHLFWS
jgi:hypothetical protein